MVVIKKIILILMALSLTIPTSCASSPKHYTKPITADKARREIGKNTTLGIINSILSVLAGGYTLRKYHDWAKAEQDQRGYRSRSKSLLLTEAERVALDGLAERCNDRADETLTTAFFGTVLTVMLFNSSTRCFQTTWEWENELNQATASPGNLYLSLILKY